VRFGEVTFAKLPDINDIAVKDQCFGLDAPQIVQQFFCMAAKCAEMHIGKDYNINGAFWYGLMFHDIHTKLPAICMINVNAVLRKH
jgi:hypothetical protein